MTRLKLHITRLAIGLAATWMALHGVVHVVLRWLGFPCP